MKSRPWLVIIGLLCLGAALGILAFLIINLMDK